MPIDVHVPQVKWSMLEWHSTKETPKENERILMDLGGEVIGGRYFNGHFIGRWWSESHIDIKMWSYWPKAPKW